MIVAKIETKTLEGLWAAWEDMLENETLPNLRGDAIGVGAATDSYLWHVSVEDRDHETKCD